MIVCVCVCVCVCVRVCRCVCVCVCAHDCIHVCVCANRCGFTARQRDRWTSWAASPAIIVWLCCWLAISRAEHQFRGSLLTPEMAISLSHRSVGWGSNLYQPLPPAACFPINSLISSHITLLIYRCLHHVAFNPHTDKHTESHACVCVCVFIAASQQRSHSSPAAYEMRLCTRSGHDIGLHYLCFV